MYKYPVFEGNAVAQGANGGVEAGRGFSFQKCAALCLLLDDFPSFGKRKYFLAFEHHDDFLFAFYDDNESLDEVKAYQAKKKQLSSSWGTDDKLAKILCKLTITGQSINQDNSIIKSLGYRHSLSFISNAEIKLTNGKFGKERKSISVKEDTTPVQFLKLDKEIQIKLEEIINSHVEPNDISEVVSLEFANICLTHNHRVNKEYLVGKMTNMFGDKISDYVAAVDVLMTLFTDSELEMNKNSLPKLSHEAKWIAKSQIDNAMDILTSKKKAYNLWRDYAGVLGKSLKIKFGHSRNYQEHIDNCFDGFKSLLNSELIRVRSLVKEHISIIDNEYNECDGIIALVNYITSEYSISLEPHIIVFAVIASYVEMEDICG
ncbi:dsDNA nuclease domain-containing protein [Vibrio vulnificus]|uniref:DUF4297 domain-containing protein n=1 Tax=Vibrio vulnificus TaxID=672 RepID=A0AAW4H613_VIBVL|nr:dsDNA nuclease domain-containing protein [Vibrio vulnificus]ELV8767684.1 DUF4297 domain-containing protein [Vibrio vulnificus]MBN8120155.1 DUF4297 domain-containing protein [Vibrio vulnificus]